jgi:hypothetical protein
MELAVQQLAGPSERLWIGKEAFESDFAAPRLAGRQAVSERVLLDSRRWPSQSGGDFSELRCLVVDFWQRLKAFDRRVSALPRCMSRRSKNPTPVGHFSRTLAECILWGQGGGSLRWAAALRQKVATTKLLYRQLSPVSPSRRILHLARLQHLLRLLPLQDSLDRQSGALLSSRSTAQLRTRQLATRNSQPTVKAWRSTG